MKTISMMAVAATIAFSAVCLTATPGAAKSANAVPIKPSEHYCLSYEAGTDCGFTSYAQCEATASGIGGGCTLQGAADGAQHRPEHQ
jgi:hypothetical protein